jgi:hypothetical protein
MIKTIVGQAIGVVIGGVITFLVSRHHYKRAAEDLTKEADELRRLSGLILRGLDAGFRNIKLDYNEQGEPIRMIAMFPATVRLEKGTKE